jgi:hypothetical protein
MNNKSREVNISGTPEHKAQDSLEGLKNNEVRNINKDVQQPALNGAEEINRSVEGVASGTSPTESIHRYKDAVKKALERQYMEFLYSQSMGSWKFWAYADLQRKELNLTEEQAHTVVEEVHEEFAKSADPHDWDIFHNGTPEQKRNFQEAIAYEMYGEDPYMLAPSESGDETVTHPNTAPEYNVAPEGLDAEVRNGNQETNRLMDTEVNAAPPSVEAIRKPGGAPKDPASLLQVWRQIGVRNADNEGLEATKLYPGILEGHVIDVNGGLAEEVPAFVPTRDELMQLVNYWTKTALDC